MKTIISTLALATILSAPLAALADQTSATTTAPATPPATVAMQQNVTMTIAKRVDDTRQAVTRLEEQSRQLGPTN